MGGRLRRAGTRIRGRGSRAQQGASLVEFSLVAPLFFLILFAIIEFALAIHTEIDFSNGVSAGIREATILGSGSSLPAGLSIHDIDNQIGLAMTQNLRPDDTDRTDYYSVKLIASRYEPDASQTNPNVYQNYYGYAGHGAFDLNAYDYIPTHYSSVSNPCQYYWQAHKNNTNNPGIYLDSAEKIDLSTLLPQYDAYYPVAALLTCAASIIGDSSSTYTCAGNTASPKYPCYYYPTGRANTVNTTASNNGSLPDLLEVQINYTYKPLPVNVASSTPLGNGFNITEHADGRLEPIGINVGG